MKKVVFIIAATIVILVAAVLAFKIYQQSDLSVEKEYYGIVQSDKSLKKVCKEPKVLKFIQKHRKEHPNFTDNQGSGHILYYVVTYGKNSLAIGINGRIDSSGPTITKIFNANDLSK
ncbi:hypothetical protein AKUH3B111A_14760 [Apilactobacillus kunkeei]|uniref:hypothetical protein n=1 Tax=Apilactobacillus kunkeei TaxID=148814 RepID=UPI00110CE3DA|nr:hypothetical protein [Apilactobacillus kunkeei]TMT01742.1 hypothetical protein FD690_03030 [Apilactobacillus kunkeei]CAI2670496.1 hypothetical protein AKUH1B104J_14560 [Apilactobacillus kunkeei]CAI2671799.1 hypothetical protein AKUH3B103M_14830 [Apilactobacillus kunkeei]CAI2671842.1 hypothetical protein AKUH3B111A_14760 [Apilactobacillus kunkeei]CAI2672473.1 hypothetical protein AKUH3B104X_14830 [Apilactobacillus kunkeei]